MRTIAATNERVAGWRVTVKVFVDKITFSLAGYTAEELPCHGAASE